MFPDTRALAFTSRHSTKKISLEVLERSICIAARSSVFKKTEDEPVYCPDRYELLQIIETMQKFWLFAKDIPIV